jgi:O-antigen ligase
LSLNAQRKSLPARVRFAWLLTMAAAGLLPLVPDQISFFSVFFAAAFGAFCLFALIARIRRRDERIGRVPSIALVLFFLSIGVSLPIALSNGVSPAEWLRGALPFCFLLVYPLFPRLTGKDCEFVLRTILFAVVCWTAKNLIRSLGEFLGGGASRITYLNPDFGIPFVLVGLPLLLFYASRRRTPESVLFALVLLFIVIATGYRSQALLAVLLWLAYVAWQRRRRRLVLALTTLVAGGAAFTVFAASRFGSEYLQRYDDLQGEVQSSRAVEALYAIRAFQQSPVTGKGLGFPVPIAINTFGLNEAPPADQPDHVGYIHNVWLYLCMDLGLAGLAVYLTFFGSAIVAGLRRGQRQDFQVAAAAALATLLIYFTVEASFRLIQINLVLGALCAVLTKHRGQVSEAAPPAPAPAPG